MNYDDDDDDDDEGSPVDGVGSIMGRISGKGIKLWVYRVEKE